MVRDVLPLNIEIDLAPDDADKRDYNVVFDKAKKVLGFEAKTGVLDGVLEIYNALKKCDYEIFSLTKKSNDFKKFIKFEGFLNYRHYILAL